MEAYCYAAAMGRQAPLAPLARLAHLARPALLPDKGQGPLTVPVASEVEAPGAEVKETGRRHQLRSLLAA